MPSLGVVYGLNRIQREEPGATPVEEEGPREPGDPGDMEGFARQQGFGQRDGGVSSPFQDPTQMSSGGAPTNFEPPNRDSIKSSQPLMISGSNDAAFDDPGVAPISGEVVVSEDGNMVRIPDGTFIMGLTDEDQFDIQNAGRKLVTISSFYMDRFEVTNAEYRNFLNNADNSEELLPDSAAWAESASRADWSTYFYGSTYDDYPVVAISWEEAGAYCDAQGKRLPTEAEWEYAARSGAWVEFTHGQASRHRMASVVGSPTIILDDRVRPQTDTPLPRRLGPTRRAVGASMMWPETSLSGLRTHTRRHTPSSPTSTRYIVTSPKCVT